MQLITLWTRAAGIMQRSNLIGPLIHMVVSMIWDVSYFLILLFVVFMGFMLSFYFVVGQDLIGSQIATLSNAGLYMSLVLLGQHEWTSIRSCTSQFLTTLHCVKKSPLQFMVFCASDLN